jgi:hypothetical protein
MTGQGRPRPSRRFRAPIARRVRPWAVRLALAAACLGGGRLLPAADHTLRVRIEWGGGSQRQWQGTIRVSEGTLADPLPLGVEADTPGSMWIDDGALRIAEPSLRAYDGVDLTVHSPGDARLVIALHPHDQEGPERPFEVELAELNKEFQTRELDDGQNRLLVRRAPGDKLRVTFSAGALIFDPDERVTMELEPYLLGLTAGTKVRCELRLTPAAGGAAAWSLDRELTVADDGPSLGKTPIKIELPKTEGVYDLTITALTRSRLGWKQSVAERKVQMVVLDPRPSPPPAAPVKAEMKLVAEIDPAHPGWWNRLSSLPLLPGLKKGSWGSGDPQIQQHSLGALAQLAATKVHEEPRWTAYPVPISSPGTPHVVEVEYADDVPQALGISIIEPNAAGVVSPIGLDSGVYVPEDASGGQPRMATHRLVFWPRTATPVVLITNRQPGTAALFGKIRVYSLGARPDAALGQDIEPGGRLLAGYLDRPLFPENFSAPEALDAWSNRSLDDWTTFHQGALRLIDALHRTGNNGLLLTVLADGSTIYPSERLAATPRYDTGTFFSTGQDPVKKDVLELLFRAFDREGLRLVPVVSFAAPLPELEQLKRRAGGQQSGLEWISRDGVAWPMERAARRGLAPYYNPLDSRVQQEMKAVVGELVERYGHHPSFGGLGLQLSADGYAQLPGPQWGFDDRTVSRFEQDTGCAVPGSGRERFAARADFLLGKKRAEWLAWRNERMEGLYRGIEEQVTEGRPDARLYVIGTGILDDPALRREWRPALPRRVPLERALLDIGLAPDLGRRLERTILLRPQRMAPLERLTEQGVDLEFNESAEIDRIFRAQSTPGALFFHEPQEVRLPSFDAKSPFKKSYTWLVAQLLPSQEHNRRRFVHSLATLDSQVLCDGGWLLPLGQEESLKPFVDVYRRLPARAFSAVEGATQPVTIRTLVEADRTYVYLANDSPWPATVRLSAEGPSCDVKSLAPDRKLPGLVREAGSALWEIELGPYDLVGVWFTAPVKLAKAEVAVSEDVVKRLEGRIQQLQTLTAALLNPVPLDVLENPSFDQPAAEGPPGWTLPATEGVTAALDKARPHNGTHAVRLTSRGPLGLMTGAPFDPPQTGRLSFSVWLRVADSERQPPLRLAVEGLLDGQEYYRHATVGDGPDAVPIGAEWGQYVFHISDLPVENLSQLRVRFDLMGPGEVWIDHVQLFDLVFSKEERIELDSRIIALASAKLRHGEVGDCQRLLDGYWPRFLAANVEPAKIATSIPPAPKAAADEPAPPQEARKPSWIDRFKGILPERLRY